MTKQNREKDGGPVKETELGVDNYREVLETEVLRRIRIMEAPDYRRVPPFNRADILFAAALAGLMLMLILWGATF